MNNNVANVLRTFYSATASEIQHGLTWYFQASGEACRRIPDRDRDIVLGVVAALSPQTAWARTIHYAERLIYEGACPSPQSRRAVALDIMAGARPEERLGGNKVRAFFACLRDQASESVCIDGHAFSCWTGERIATSQCPPISDRLYCVIANDYREGARIVGIKPHQLQAVNWLAWRRIHGVRCEVDRRWGR
jgi:hypothetical protein